MNTSIWHNEPNLTTINSLNENTLGQNLGIEFIEVGQNYLVATMPVDDRTKQPFGLLHGGANVALAETLGSVASLLVVNSEVFIGVGVEINANHIKAVLHGNVKGICPTGWHVPSDAEWTVLTDFLGGENVAGGKMKTTGTIEATTGLWVFPNSGATNSSGFSGGPTGLRHNTFGYYEQGGQYGYWWSLLEFDELNAWYRRLDYVNDNAFRDMGSNKRNGFSVRCLRD